MKFTTEKVWRSSVHPRESACRARGARWLRGGVLPTPCATNEPQAFHRCYSETAHNLFASAARRCPSISVDSDIMDGQPCIGGTRIPVRSVLRAVELQGSLSGAIECYPHLTEQQVKDAVYFAQVVLEPVGVIDEFAIAS